MGNLKNDALPRPGKMEISNQEFDEEFLQESMGVRGTKKPRKQDLLDDPKSRKRSTDEVQKDIESEMAKTLTAQEIEALGGESELKLYRESLLLHSNKDVGVADTDDASDLLQSIQWNFNQVADWIEDLKPRGEFIVSLEGTYVHLLLPLNQ